MNRLTALVAFLLPTTSAPLAPADDKPNFVLINIDDLGYAEVGPFGGKNETPNIDRMAREGRKLTSFYAAPVCSPSRAALMTGCYHKRSLPIPHVLFPAAAVGLNPDEVTVAEVLKAAGYATACVGKWHLGDQPEFLPTRQGFDSYLGLPYSNDMGPAEDGAKNSFGKPVPKRRQNARTTRDETGIRGPDQPPLPLLENETVIERVRAAEQQTLVRRYTERAVAFIRENKSRPFFLYLPHNAVHWPHYPSGQFRDSGAKDLLRAWVREVDASVGQVLDALREAGLGEKTLVLFTSDNGGPVNQGADNGPLRGGKGSTWEGGVRVPAIAWWPGHVPAGTETDAVTGMIDVLPTLATLAGAKLPEGRTLDGRDVSPLLLGKPGAESPHEALFLYRGLVLEAVRSGQWKFHLAKGELYDLSTDIGESKNVAAEHPEVVQKLRGLADAMGQDLGLTDLGPGSRPLGRVENPQPLIGLDGKVRAGFGSELKSE
jgi:arylsulfatase A-like enzyme